MNEGLCRLHRTLLSSKADVSVRKPLIYRKMEWRLKMRGENKNVCVTDYEGRRKVEILKNILYEERLSQGTCYYFL